MKLLTFSLIISFLGVFLLLLLSNTIKPIQVSYYQQLKLNDKVKTTGKILNIKTYDNFNIISLDNNLTITCNKCNFKLNQTIQAEGKVAEYKQQLQINAEKINAT